MNTECKILTESEVADHLKLTHPTRIKTIQRMARAGLIRGNKVGREWRFHIKAIEDFLLVQRSRA